MLLYCSQEEKFTVPKEVQEQLEAYAARFFVLKTPRKLLWRPDLGAVDLTLTVGTEVLELTVTPVQAAILMQFRVRAPWVPLGICNLKTWLGCTPFRGIREI